MNALIHDQPNTEDFIFLDRNYVYKKSKKFYSENIRKEANYYDFLKFASNDISKYFPEYYKYDQTKNNNYIALEYLCGYNSLEKILINNIVLNKNKIIKQIIHSLNNFKNSSLSNTSFDKLFNSLYLSRLKLRIKEMRNKSNELDELYDKEIHINNKKFKSLHNTIESFLNDVLLMKRLTKYRKITFFHGDLHFGNILVNKNSKIKYVDPNGLITGILSYDYGKIFHSTIGSYNLIQNYRYNLISKNDSEFLFSVNSNDEYNNFSRKLNRLIKKTITKELYEQSLFAFFVHMVSLISHHLKNEKKQALAFYLQAVIIGCYTLNKLKN